METVGPNAGGDNVQFSVKSKTEADLLPLVLDRDGRQLDDGHMGSSAR